MERLAREFARLIMQRTIRNIEAADPDQTVSSFNFNGQSYRRNRRTTNSIDTRFGAVSFDRWYFQNTQCESPGVAPLDVRLGIVAKRMTPALAEVTGRLAADLPQQAARDMLTERFGVTVSVEAYRRVVAELATRVRCVHDEEAIKQLVDWMGGSITDHVVESSKKCIIQQIFQVRGGNNQALRVILLQKLQKRVEHAANLPHVVTPSAHGTDRVEFVDQLNRLDNRIEFSL